MDFGKKPFYLTNDEKNWVEETFHSLTDEEKIRQLFCLVLYDDNEEYIEYLSREVRPGGFMCRVMPGDTLRNAISAMQKKAKIPMLVSANLEAGGSGILKEGTRMGCNMAISATNDVKYAKMLGKVCGAEGKSVGANWAFAPVTDLDTDWRNPSMNTRTFGSNLKINRAFSTAYIKELQKYGVASAPKHFPGDGQDERDPHVSISVNPMTPREWDKTYGKIYEDCIDAGTKTIMVGHIMLPNYSKKLAPNLKDEDILPATLSKELLQGLLRRQLGFEGLIVTDSSAMAGFGTHMPRKYAIPYCIEAGCDMLLFTKNTEEDIRYMEEGLKKGILSVNRLNEAVLRILALKASLGLSKPVLPTPLSEKELEEHRKWATEVIEKSITLVKEEKGILPLSPKKYPRVLLYPLDKKNNTIDGDPVHRMLSDALSKRGYQVDVFQPVNATEGKRESAEELQKKYDLMLYSCAIKGNYQPGQRIEWSKPQGSNVPVFVHSIPTVAVSFANPYLLADIPQIKTYINCYQSGDTVVEKLMEKLEGGGTFEGVSPIDATCGKWDAGISFKKTPPRSLKGLIFDLDGVLLSTDRYHFLAWKSLADELGIPFTEKDNEQFRGVSRMDCLELLLKWGNIQNLSDEEKNALATKKNERYKEYLNELNANSITDEVRNTLKKLRDMGYSLAVGSSSKNTRLILDKTNLTDSFDAIADGNDITKSKPDPEVFLKATEKLGLTPFQCAVIEDAEAGLQAAVSGEMLPIAYGASLGNPLGEIQLEHFRDLTKLK